MTALRPRERRARFVLGAFLLGVGMGGFVDGIVMHQLLQWHHMVSSIEPATTLGGLETNTLWDGIFHVLAFTLTGVGAVVISGAPAVAGRTAVRAFTALFLAGWGAFNLVDSAVNHFLLELHHVREEAADPLAWDLGFLVIAALMFAGGAWWAHRTLRALPPHPAP